MSRRLRVAMIIQAFRPVIGGAERQLESLLPLLADRGVDSIVYTRRYDGLAPTATVAATPVVRLPIPGNKVRAAATFTATALAHLARDRPDVIHAYELLSPATTAVLAGALLRRPTAVKVLRGGELGDVAKVRDRRTRPVRLAALRHGMDRFVVISDEIDRELDAIGIEPARRSWIPNGVDTDRFAPVDTAVRRRRRTALGAGDGPVVAYVGRLSTEKGLAALQTAWRGVVRAHPQAQLVVAGTGEDVGGLDAPDLVNVHLVGAVDDPTAVLQAADVFVLPSRTEGLSNSLLEAMASGLTCVATEVGAAPELLAEGRGRLIAVPDPDALQTTLEEVLALAPERRTEIGATARHYVQEHYSLATTADRLRSLYDELARS